MPKNYISVPTDWEKLTGFSQLCPCGKVHAIDTQKVIVEDGALNAIGAVCKMVFTGHEIGVLADARTMEVAGSAVCRRLERGGGAVVSHIIPDGPGGRPHATFDAVLQVEEAMRAMSAIVAVGSGTINDLAKLASYRLGIPYLVVPTAPSMNGYTSAIAAIMKDGLKQTIDCHQPAAVVADLDILCAAPRHLIQAGLGDLESKPVCTADFLLSAMLHGTYYCPVPGDVVAQAESQAAACADGIARGDNEAIGVLTEALLLSGCSMKLAGSSSPASGGEHLISHYWDMTAEMEGRVEGFHGAQVGVATIVTASLYEYLRQISPASIDVEKLVAGRLGREEEKRQVIERHGPFGDGAAEEFMKKRLDDEAYRRELKYIVENWDMLWERFGMLKSADSIRAVLAAAGAPTTMTDVDLTASHLKKSLLHAREIRGRFTVLDFAADLGVLETGADDVLAMSRCLETD